MRELTTAFTLPGMSPAPDPAAIWDLLRRADDLVKYAQHRDNPNANYKNAHDLLVEAEELANAMSPGQADYFIAQIELRKNDLDKIVKS